MSFSGSFYPPSPEDRANFFCWFICRLLAREQMAMSRSRQHLFGPLVWNFFFPSLPNEKIRREEKRNRPESKVVLERRSRVLAALLICSIFRQANKKKEKKSRAANYIKQVVVGRSVVYGLTVVVCVS